MLTSILIVIIFGFSILIFLMLSAQKKLNEKINKLGNDDFLIEMLSAKLSPQFQQASLQVIDKIYEGREVQLQRFDEFREKFSKTLKEDFQQLNQNVEKNLQAISVKLHEGLDEGLKKSNETFNNIIERLAKIDQAQKKIEQLSQNVVSLQDVLTDKKSRGIMGEVQLHHLLTTVFGEKSKVYELQCKLTTGVLADAMLFLPNPTGNIAIDSKFPLENFRRMVDPVLSDDDRLNAKREFKKNVQKHVDDIASKYIIPGETAEQAIMFIPAEAIFAEIHAYFPEIVDYAHGKKVWLSSPTTIMAILTTVQVVLNNMERTKYADVIHQELLKLGDEFKRYKERWSKLSDHIENVSKDVRDIHITTNKITDRFAGLSRADFSSLLTTPLE